jgi:transglutaminase-like putative cysteine protease
MNNVFLLSRPLLVGLLLICSAVMLLHVAQLPIWMFALCGGVFIWQLNIIKEKWRAPRGVLKTLLVASSGLLLFLEYQQWLSIEPMLTLLLLALTLKLLEVRSQKDVVLILFLAYFSIACSFLFDQSVLHTLFGVLSVIAVTIVLFHVFSTSATLKKSISLVVKMLLQSVLLALVMMLIFPRLGPLWSVPLQSGNAMTGMSDSMSPGDFDELIRSNALAFRVTFPEDTIPRESMYWRGLVLDDFDGRRWQRSTTVAETVASQNRTQQHRDVPDVGGIQYDVLMEPTSHHWLYGISQMLIEPGQGDLIYTEQNEVFQKTAVNQRIQYTAVSYPNISLLGHGLAPYEWSRYTALPQDANPRTLAQARVWRQQAGNDQKYINTVLSYFRENFTYTLSPPKLGQHTADEFLFSTQAGFCEHYSSSFVILMRSVGIPARVVVGYQGGEWDDNKTYLSVYQRDAHAWAEVWLNGAWVRVDPTAAVASVRIQQGVAAALPQAEKQWVGSTGSQFTWVSEFQSQWREMDYRWQRWVLSYDSQQQQNILKKYLGELTATKMIIVVLISLAVAVLLISISLFYRLLPATTKEKFAYNRLKRKLGRLGVDYEEGETIAFYCDRAAKIFPHRRAKLNSIKREMEYVFYAVNTSNKKVFKRSISTLNNLIRTL